MAIQVNNLIMAGLRGTIGKQVVFRQRGGKTFVSAYPDMSRRVLSEKQLRNTERMKEASLYARSIMADHERRGEALIRLHVPVTRLYNALVSEFFKAERVKETANK